VAARLQITCSARIRRCCALARPRSARQWWHVSRPGQNKARELSTERFIVATPKPRAPLERSSAGQPSRRRPTSATIACPARGASTSAGYARVSGGGRCHCSVQPVAHCGHCARVRAAIPGTVQRSSSSRADLSRVGRLTEPLRRTRSRPRCGVAGECPRRSRRLGAPSSCRGTRLDDPPVRFPPCVIKDDVGAEVRMIRTMVLATHGRSRRSTQLVSRGSLKDHRLVDKREGRGFACVVLVMASAATATPADR
jgi:hypothetical protein